MRPPAAGRRSLDEAVDTIVEKMVARGRLLVAFSGGVDSALVAHLAHNALGDDALAVTAASESMALRELETARATAMEIGIRHRVIRYSDLANPDYVANTRDRCFHCRRGMATHMLAVAEEEGMAHLADGLILDDLGDFRPGTIAMDDAGFWHPLVEAGLGKEAVRTVARLLGLSVHGRPSNACLSSRMRRGTPVTLELLRRVESGEEMLRSLGFRQIRVRAECGGARVEVGQSEVPRLLSQPVASRVTPALQDLGFSHVELDAKGYRSGERTPAPTPQRGSSEQ